MTIKEKAAYVKGLLSGLELDESKKETKVLKAIIDWMEEASGTINDIDEDVSEVFDEMEALDEDLADLEDVIYDDDECCCDDDCTCGCHDGEKCSCDDDFYEVTCPTCGEHICFSEETLLDDEMNCPKCGELLEFDFDECDCGSECDCDYDDTCECECHDED